LTFAKYYPYNASSHLVAIHEHEQLPGLL